MTSMRAYDQTGRGREGGAGQAVVHAGRCYWPWIAHATTELARQQHRPGLGGDDVHSHTDLYHIVLFTAGDSEFVLGDRRCPAGAGTLALSCPGDRHSFSPVGGGQVVYSEVTFGLYEAAGDALALEFHRMVAGYTACVVGAGLGPRHADGRQAQELQAQFSRLMDALEERTPFGMFAARQALGGMLGLLAREFLSDDRRPEARGLAAARACLEARYREKLTVPQLAELAGLSAGYFLRAFRRAYGVPPMVYQGRLRVAAARTLLRSTDLGCKEIADRLGYSDEFHFSKSFRRAAGCPPGQYRRSGRGA
jgi:AraC-like DNA-binding protein/mannose-6-phosphate isomerase-like protein (cupin superfamily)